MDTNNYSPSFLKVRSLLLLTLFALSSTPSRSQDMFSRSVVSEGAASVWHTFPLSATRILPGSPFYQAMKTDQAYLTGMDIDKMLRRQRKAAGLPIPGPYPGSNQPADTRPGDLHHYLSAISLMYAQTGDTTFLTRERYIVSCLSLCYTRTGRDSAALRRRNQAWQKILNGELLLNGTDEYGYPWGGTIGNDFYGIHKELASLRDAYIYTGDTIAFRLLRQKAAPIVSFILRANPDLFDDLLDIEHGGMNEVLADCYALTGDKAFLDASFKCNHRKVILPLAENEDILSGRHANMQVPTLVGTARQYQLTGNKISRSATANFLDIIYRDHMDAIGGSGRYERYGNPGETTEDLGYTADETCVTYNMLKIALQYFQSTGDLRHMDYFERALYNHILASQDPESMGVTYYTSLMPGSFKSFSKTYDLEGVWCCVGTGMENHAKYGEAIYFHDSTDLLVNLFIPSSLYWQEQGLDLVQETKFPAADDLTLTIRRNDRFKGAILLRRPQWAHQGIRIWINDIEQPVDSLPGNYIRLTGNWRKNDRIRVEIPQDFHLETASDDPHMGVILHGPLVLAGALGKNHMPGSDLVRSALPEHRNDIPYTADIPLLLVNPADPAGWLRANQTDSLLSFTAGKAGRLDGKTLDITLLPFYEMRHQRYTVYWKLYSPEKLALRRQLVSDEINPADAQDEKRHSLKGEHTDTSSIKDERHFWENNRPGRFAAEGGWFSYQLRLPTSVTIGKKAAKKVATESNVSADSARPFLVVTYWGSTPAGHAFDIYLDDQRLAGEDFGPGDFSRADFVDDSIHRHTMSYFERAYLIPGQLLSGKRMITVRFQGRPGQIAGPVYGLRITSDPGTFPHYLFY